MQSKIWRWAEVIADSAPYVFWTIWGAGLGAFGAVLLKAVDIGGDALKVYLGIITVMMGAALGLITSRGMDIIADRRKTRRKLYAARISIEELSSEIEFYLRKIDEVRAARAGSDGQERNPTSDEALAVLVRRGRVNQACQHLPDLDEVVESEIGLHHARRVRSRYLFLQDNTEKLSDVPSDKWIAKANTAISDLSRGNLVRCIDTLTEARTYLENRTGSG